ncbi:8-amino-7-oxononanoate synthase [Carex littledalei]|uniref:8-amino-7-oxononanoate synthase n=1 Tax=Carex littledalei TaxID=544730 RepID=A0A833RG08_9POAL|nr:8-amino-7-oxononanoate synthase [Carex littledalei]
MFGKPTEWCEGPVQPQRKQLPSVFQLPLAVELGPGILGNIFDGIQSKGYWIVSQKDCDYEVQPCSCYLLLGLHPVLNWICSNMTFMTALGSIVSLLFPVEKATRAAVSVGRREKWMRRAIWKRVQDFYFLSGLPISSSIISLVVGTEQAAASRKPQNEAVEELRVSQTTLKMWCRIKGILNGLILESERDSSDSE